MHQSAIFHAHRFFETYCPASSSAGLTIAEIGAQNVNGSLRDIAPAGAKYIGLDFVDGAGVDIVISDPYVLPLPDASVDVVVSSSCFEHSEFFWLVFLEAMRILKPSGLFYLNAPSNGSFHRYPVDCWRFYPDSGHALATWGRRNGYNSMLLESFIGQRSPSHWCDFVAIFLKDKQHVGQYPNRVVRHLDCFFNGYANDVAGILNATHMVSDLTLITNLTRKLRKSAEEIKSLNGRLQEKEAKIAELTAELAIRTLSQA
jgi:SAM-dependent methyltransferase